MSLSGRDAGGGIFFTLQEIESCKVKTLREDAHCGVRGRVAAGARMCKAHSFLPNQASPLVQLREAISREADCEYLSDSQDTDCSEVF